MPEPLDDMDRILEAQEFAYRRRAPLPPEVLEQRMDELTALRVRLDKAIVAQSSRLVAERQAELDDWMTEARRDRG